MIDDTGSDVAGFGLSIYQFFSTGWMEWMEGDWMPELCLQDAVATTES